MWGQPVTNESRVNNAKQIAFEHRYYIWMHMSFLSWKRWKQQTTLQKHPLPALLQVRQSPVASYCRHNLLRLGKFAHYWLSLLHFLSATFAKEALHEDCTNDLTCSTILQQHLSDLKGKQHDTFQFKMSSHYMCTMHQTLSAFERRCGCRQIYLQQFSAAVCTSEGLTAP